MMRSSAAEDGGAAPLCQVVAPTGMLGYGVDEDLIAYELSKLVPSGVPTAIILDSGSTDSGPEKLALGVTTCPRASYLKDMSALLRLVHKFRVPLIISSAGGDGTNQHVKLMEEIVQEIVDQEQNSDYNVKAISIFCEIDKSIILQRLREGRIVGCGSTVPQLTKDEVDLSPQVVAQVGPEPFIDAMLAEPDFNLIIGGRAYDPAPFVGYAIYQLKRQYPELSDSEIQKRRGGFLHLGEILECGGLCAVPKSSGAVGIVFANGVFDLRPLLPNARCTSVSVAAHTLYENPRPDILSGPGGTLHLNQSKYQPLSDGRTVRVSGSEFRPSSADGRPYQFKLESARVVGFRAMFMGSVKDHILIKQIDTLIPRIKAYVKDQHSEVTGAWDLEFHVYGKGQETAQGPGELFIVAEALAPTQELATSLAAKARIAMIHGAYPGIKATAGNFAFGIGGKLEYETGPCAKFSMYHLMDLEPGEERLSFGTEGEGTATQIVRAGTQVFGKGKRQTTTEEFRNTIAHIRDTTPAPESKNPNKRSSKMEVTPTGPPQLIWDVAEVLRSKNAGPYDISIDIMFYSEVAYHIVKDSNFLTHERVAQALGVTEEDIIWIGFFEPAFAFKVTIPRLRGGKKVSAGGFMEDDIHGSQKHMELALMKLPSALSFPAESLVSR